MRRLYILLLCASALGAQAPDSAGRKLFLASCSGCHGANAEGGRGPNLTEGRAIRRLDDEGLFAAIKSGVPGTDMPPTNLPDEQIRTLAAYVRSLSAPAYESKVAGDAEAGASIFFGQAGCSGCHMIRGRGGFIGPDLTDIGALRTINQLRFSLLNPSARIVDGYEGVTATLRDGSKISGVSKNANNYSMQILDKSGALRLLSMDEIREVEFRKNSLMPADFGKRLSPADIDNVLAFLSRQSVRPPRGHQK